MEEYRIKPVTRQVGIKIFANLYLAECSSFENSANPDKLADQHLYHFPISF